MDRRYALLLLMLGAAWGSSYLFYKIGVRGLSPADLVEVRLLFAAPPLLAFAAGRYGWRALRRAWREGLVLGALNAAVPFTLIAWGERSVDSGTAAVASSSVPIFVALLAVFFAPSERSTGWRLAGILLGLVGVAILAGVQPPGGVRGSVGVAAIVVSSISYAVAAVYAGRRIAVGGPVLAATGVACACLLLLPLALATLPSRPPGWTPIGCGIALGLLGTAFAQILSYRMIHEYGAARAALVAYLLPAFALFFGAVFLHEPLTSQKLAGLALITGGVVLAAGAARRMRREAALRA